MFLPAAFLILLSVASAEDAKRCFWCGPLAEQVHRSQRAPSCGPELEETICDPGYTHCAVVATSPPYAESRLCVKFYQDECYSLYCNSSKTWRMICPCKGDLCNGQNTERETKAFTALTKIAAKNKRSKRCLVEPRGFIPITPRKTENNNTSQSETTIVMTDEPTNEIVEAQTVMINVLEEQDVQNDVDNDISDTNKDSETEMQGDQPIESEVTATTQENIEISHNEQSGNTDVEEKTVESTTAMIEENNENQPMVTIPAEEVKIEESEIVAVTSTKPTTIELELSVVHITNPNVNLPLPESLQQNVTPAKATAPTTLEPVEMTTMTQIEITTQSIKDVTTKIEKTTEKNNVKKNEEKRDEDKAGKNGDQTLVHAWELVVLMNILVYITM